MLEERKHLVRDVDMDDDARSFAEMRLENLPAGTAAAVNELSDYEWQSPAARADYERIKELLGRELLDQRFAGMKNALEGATDADRQAIRDMLGDLNELLEKRRLGRGHRRGLRRVHAQARRRSSPRIRRISTSCSTPSPSARPRPSGCSTP